MNKLSQLVEVGIGGLNKPKEHDKDKYIRQYEIEEEMKQGGIIRFRETLHNQKGKDRQGKSNGKSKEL